jgi:ankyrin repeat protein
MIAVERGHSAIVQTLLRSGPDLSLRDRRGRDVFDLARAGQRSSLIALLLAMAALRV